MQIDIYGLARLPLAATCLIITLHAPILAQSVEPMPSNSEEYAGPVCMLRPLSDARHVGASQRGQPLRIVSTESIAPSLEAKGFSKVDCKVADLVLASKRNGWRDHICKLAARGNESLQNQLERALGERPAVLCASAEAAVGQWDRKSSETPTK